MSALHDALTEYLAARRALGTQLMWPESSLRNFVDFVEAEGAEFLTTELAVRWVFKSVDVQRATHARRLAIVRAFAVWLQATDARTQVPPRRLLPAQYRRLDHDALRLEEDVAAGCRPPRAARRRPDSAPRRGQHRPVDQLRRAVTARRAPGYNTTLGSIAVVD
jgi:hypothetical protein